MYTYLKAASTFCNYSRIRFMCPTGRNDLWTLGLVTGSSWGLWVWLQGICWWQSMGSRQCWNRHGFEDVRLALLVLFSFESENNTEIYAQACKCDWTSCNTLKMQQVCLVITDDEPMWTKTASGVKKKKKSILFVLPDILMFNMRVLYYHDDYDYSCVQFLSTVVLMLHYFSMIWTLGLRMMAIL